MGFKHLFLANWRIIKHDYDQETEHGMALERMIC
jgi:hypothetical protein